MEFNKTVSNPMLLGCIELMKDDNSPEHRKMFFDEFERSSFMTPAIIEPAPLEDEEGNLTLQPGSKVQFPMLTTVDGRKFYMAFADKMEYENWQQKNQKFPWFVLKIDDYARMLLGKDPQGNTSPAIGMVINPLSANVVITREMLSGIMTQRFVQSPMGRAMMQAKAKAQAEKQAAAEEATE